MTGGVKPFNGIPNPLLISGSSTTIHLKPGINSGFAEG
jgi:hypothetical protein